MLNYSAIDYSYMTSLSLSHTLFFSPSLSLSLSLSPTLTPQELLIATRHILATDFRRGFVPHLDDLLEESLFLGPGQPASLRLSVSCLISFNLIILSHIISYCILISLYTLKCIRPKRYVTDYIELMQ